MITGSPDTRKHIRKESLSDAITGAATALVNALSTSPKVPSIPKQGVSPSTHANLRRKHLEDIRILYSLYDDGILSLDEYQEQKENILITLRDLKQ